MAATFKETINAILQSKVANPAAALASLLGGTPWSFTAGSTALNLKAGASADHVYMQLYADSAAQSTRSGWFGYGSAGTSDMAIKNEMTGGNLNLSTLGTITFDKPVRLKNFTVATLPAGTQGDTAFVTDSLTPTFLSVLVGGGTVVTPVFYNGTNWVTV